MAWCAVPSVSFGQSSLSSISGGVPSWKVRVVAPSRLQMLRLEAAGRGTLRMEGVLEDDLGHGLVGRLLSVRVDASRDETSGGAGRDAVVRRTFTREGGRFGLLLPWPSDRAARVSVVFGGGEDATGSALRLRWDPAHPLRFLRLAWPEGRLAAPGRSSLPLRLSVLPPEGTEGWNVRVRTRAGASLGAGRIREGGVGALVLNLKGLRRPGVHALLAEVTSTDGTRFLAEASVGLAAEVRLRTEVRYVGQEGTDSGLSLRVEARAGSAPLAGRFLAVFEGEDIAHRRHLRTLRTDVHGRIELFLPPASRGPWWVRFDGEPPLLSAAELRVLRPHPRQDRSDDGVGEGAVPWWWLWLPLLAALLVWGGRRVRGARQERTRWRRDPPETTSMALPRLRMGREAKARSSRSIRLRVVDRRRGVPLDEAVLRLVGPLREGGGEEQMRSVEAPIHRGFENLVDGRYRLLVEAVGYVPERFDLVVPHEGGWEGARVSLEAVRDRVERELEPLARCLLGGPPALPWEQATFAQLEARAGARADAWSRQAARLLRRAERLLYGPRVASWKEAKELLDQASALVARSDAPGMASDRVAGASLPLRG